MVYCGCGKSIDKVPVWMAAIQVEFVCKDCPNRQTKSIAFVQLAPPAAAEPAEVVAAPVVEAAAEEPAEEKGEPKAAGKAKGASKAAKK